jgi:hypothetical protein
MPKTSMIATFGLAMAASVFAQNNGTASVNSVDYQSGNSAPVSYEAQMPSAPVVSTTSIPPNIQAELEARTDEYHSRKSKAIIFGIIGTALDVTGGILMQVAVKSNSNSCSQYDNYCSSTTDVDWGTYLTGLGFAVAGIPFEVIGIVNTVHAIVKGNQLRNYEERVGYRLSVRPTLNPRTGQAGMVASLHF